MARGCSHVEVQHHYQVKKMDGWHCMTTESLLVTFTPINTPVADDAALGAVCRFIVLTKKEKGVKICHQSSLTEMLRDQPYLALAFL